jgi:hypothetical protein
MANTVLRDAIAAMVLDQAQNVAAELGPGVQVEFRRDNAASGVTVWAIMTATPDSRGILGGETDERCFDLLVPRQTGFPPTGYWRPGDKFMHEGLAYGVDSVQADNTSDELASTWTFHCTRFGEVVGNTVELDG